MHTGRVSHPANMLEGSLVLAPSAIVLSGEMWTDKMGMQSYATPSAMSETQIEKTIEEFVHSAELAIKAGFDGVEIHGANGYLVDQFLNTASNHRTDNWGGSIENRCRFALEIARRMAQKIGKEKVGIRLSPFGVFNDMASDEKMNDTFEYLAEKLNDLGITYIHLVDHSSMGAPVVGDEIKKIVRLNFKKTLILSGGYDVERAQKDLTNRDADLIAFGRPFISNPRLVTKLKENLPLTPMDPTTLYTPGAKGYTDYPL
jgi:N-ethylmaleimide reductase